MNNNSGRPSIVGNLQDKLVDVLVAAEQLRFEDPDKYHGVKTMGEHPAFIAASKLQDAVDKALAGIPGVAAYVDPLSHQGVGVWTTDLNSSLRDLLLLLYRHWHLVMKQAPSQYLAAIAKINEKHRWLLNVDFSAIRSSVAIEQPIPIGPRPRMTEDELKNILPNFLRIVQEKENRNITAQALADKLGVARTSLYKDDPPWSYIRDFLMSPDRELPRGFKSRDGDMGAWDKPPPKSDD